MPHAARQLPSWLTFNVRQKMKKPLPTFARVVGELVVSGPIIVYFPFAVLMAPSVAGLMFVGKGDEKVGALAVVFGAIGLLSLYASILLPLAWFCSSKRLRLAMLVGLMCGLLATLCLIFQGEADRRIIDKWDAWYTWFFGGPVVLAILKITLLLKRPNKALEPTPPSVTPPADAGVAPDGGVAHL